MQEVKSSDKIFLGQVEKLKMNMPSEVIPSLEKHLKIYSFLKKKFTDKLDVISMNSKSKYPLDIMLEYQKVLDQRTFTEIAYLLGMSPKRPYNHVYNKHLSEWAQAKDYVRLLYDFDNQMQKVINYCITNKVNINIWYKYIEKLGE